MHTYTYIDVYNMLHSFLNIHYVFCGFVWKKPSGEHTPNESSIIVCLFVFFPHVWMINKDIDKAYKSHVVIPQVIMLVQYKYMSSMS